jgi:hypothetical protein
VESPSPIVVEPPPSIRATPTSLDPYGQLIKMLLPRALCVVIYDRSGLPLWFSDGCDGPDLHQLVDQALQDESRAAGDVGDGYSRSVDGTAAYLCVLRDDSREVLGFTALSCRDNAGGEPRPFTLIHALLRPVLEVLGRELLNQDSLLGLKRSLATRDQDLELVLGAGGSTNDNDA